MSTPRNEAANGELIAAKRRKKRKKTEISQKITKDTKTEFLNRTTFQTPMSNLMTPFNGPLTSRGAIQLQLITPTIVGPIVPNPVSRMGTLKGQSNPEFPKGSKVRIASRTVLEEFTRTWKYHNPLRNDQLELHDVEAVVEDVGFYHGGDELYKLKGLPGVWHEQCLKEV